MLRNLNGTLIALLIAVLPAISFGADAKRVHTTTSLSTMASDCTNYYAGDAEAFNSMLAKLATGFVGTIGEKGMVPNPNITVSIFKGTGKAYLTQSMTRKPDADEVIVFHVPPVPREVIDGTLDPFNFDWLVVSSATNNANRQVSVVLFTGGGVDLFECVIPENVSLKIAKPLVVTTTTAATAKPGNGR